MNGTISLFIHSFIFIIHYGGAIMLLQDMGVIGKNSFMRHEMGNTKRKIRKGEGRGGKDGKKEWEKRIGGKDVRKGL
jgi:hypothetical protein